MNARRSEQPFTRGSTFATVMVVVFIVGSIAIAVAYFGNKEWGEPSLAELAEQAEKEAPHRERDSSLAGTARPSGPQVNAVYKSVLDDPWPTPKAPIAPPLLASEQPKIVSGEPNREAAEIAEPGESTLGGDLKPLPKPSLNLDVDLAEADLETKPKTPLPPLDSEAKPTELFKGPALTGPGLTDEDELTKEPSPIDPADLASEESAEPVNTAKVATPNAATERETLQAAAESAGTFRTFLELAAASRYGPLLEKDKFHTLIAPSDKAFAAIPQGQVKALLLPAHRDKLDTLIAYHLLSGNHSAKALANRRHAETLAGQRLAIQADGVTLRFNDATLSSPSIVCRNGMVHGVDRVLLPVADHLGGVLELDDEFSMLRQLVEQAELQDALSGDETITLFAPTDDAFKQMPTELLTRLAQPENHQMLKSVLLYHMAPGRLYSQDLLAGQPPRAFQGEVLQQPIDAAASGDVAKLFAKTDLQATNGVVHKVNRVMLPPEFETTVLRPQSKPIANEPTDMRKHWQTTLEKTVAGGKQLYTNGDFEGCAKAYEKSIQNLLQTTPEDVLPTAREALMKAIVNADRQESANDQAWALRRGINQAYAELFSK